CPVQGSPRSGGGGARRLRDREHPPGVRAGLRSSRLGTRPTSRAAVLRSAQIRHLLWLLPGPGIPADPGRDRGSSRVGTGSGPVGRHAGVDQRNRNPVLLLRLGMVPRAGAPLPERPPGPAWGPAGGAEIVPPGLPGGTGPRAAAADLPEWLPRPAPAGVRGERLRPASFPAGGAMNGAAMAERLRLGGHTITITANLAARVGAIGALWAASLLVART